MAAPGYAALGPSRTHMHPQKPTFKTADLDTLVLDPENARLHPDSNLEAIKGSLELFGQVEPLVVQQGTHRVIGGNGRLTAMRQLGWKKAEVAYIDCTDAQATALGLALNRTAETAAWDTDTLAELVERCRAEAIAVESFGFDSHAIDKIIARAERDAQAEAVWDEAQTEQVPEKPAPDDDPGEAPKDSRVKRGDIWALGPHRLICADASDHNAVTGLMGGQKADMIFTDPPYNCGGENKMVASSIRKGYADLKAAEWDQAFDFADVEQNMLSIMADSCSVYVCTSHHLFGQIMAWMKTWSDHDNFCVWAKSNPMPSLQKRHYTWCSELICYATRGKHTFNFPQEGHTLNVWNLPKSVKNDLHPTMKPVAVPAHAIRHSSKPGDIVVDLFGGAGSTLLACEQLGRTCYMSEISELHCETILRRYERETGKKATRLDREEDDA